MSNTFTEIEMPEVYENYKELLPPFATMMHLAFTELATVYKTYVEKNGLIGEDDEGELISAFLNKNNGNKFFDGGLQTYRDSLMFIVSGVLIDYKSCHLDEKFLAKIREEQDAHGFEAWEDRWEIITDTIEDTVYEIHEAVVDEIRYMEIGPLNKMLVA